MLSNDALETNWLTLTKMAAYQDENDWTKFENELPKQN